MITKAQLLDENYRLTGIIEQFRFATKGITLDCNILTEYDPNGHKCAECPLGHQLLCGLYVKTAGTVEATGCEE